MAKLKHGNHFLDHSVCASDYKTLSVISYIISCWTPNMTRAESEVDLSSCILGK